MVHRTTAGVSTGENRNARLSTRGNTDAGTNGHLRSGGHRDGRKHKQTHGFAGSASAMLSPRRTEIDYVDNRTLRTDEVSSRRQAPSTRDRMAGRH